MANDVSNINQQKYRNTLQALLQEDLVALDVCRTDLRKDMPNGNTINYPRPVYMNVSDYTKYTTHTAQDLTFTNETLTINQTPMIRFVYDEVDRMDNGWEAAMSTVRNNAYRIKQHLEGDLFSLYSSASYGTSDAATALTIGASQNVTTTYGNPLSYLVNDGVGMENMVILADPFSIQKIGGATLNNVFKEADNYYRRGYRGTFLDADLRSVTNLTATTTLQMATNPTADDTTTVMGVTWTWKASATAAGQIKIGANAAASVDNLVAAINGSGTGDGTDYYEVSATNRAKLSGLTATDGTTSIGLVSKRGASPTSFSTSHTAAADDFDAVVIWNIVMERGAIDLVMQKDISTVSGRINGQVVTEYLTWLRYGKAVFTEGAERMYALPIQIAAAES